MFTVLFSVDGVVDETHSDEKDILDKPVVRRGERSSAISLM